MKINDRFFSLHSLTLLLGLFVFVSCSDIYSKKKAPEGQLASSSLMSCELDAAAFSEIFEKDITNEVDCLEDTLALFMEVVRVDDQHRGQLSKEALFDFIRGGAADMEEDDLLIIDGVFELSFMLFGGEPGYIFKEDLKSLFELIKEFNLRMWRVYRYFSLDEEVTYQRHLEERKAVFDQVVLFTNKALSFFKGKTAPLPSEKIDTKGFIEKIFQSDRDVLDKTFSLLFLKRVFLGGSVEELNRVEFKQLLFKLGSLIQIAFDLMRLPSFDFTYGQGFVFDLFYRDLINAKAQMFFTGSSYDTVFSVSDVISVIEQFWTDLDIDLRKYDQEVALIKGILVETESGNFSGMELHQLADHFEILLAKGVDFYRFYEFFNRELSSKGAISLDISRFPAHDSRTLSFLRDFGRIMGSYHFFGGSQLLPNFSFDFIRNENAAVEIMALEYIATEVMKKYGSYSPLARGLYHMSYDQTLFIIDKLKYVLKDMGIITIGKKGGGEVESATNNVVLISTLFQFQSDGCNTKTTCMEIPEVVEFLAGIISALKVQDFFVDQMKEFCADRVDEYGRIYIDCFREHFIKVFESPIPGEQGLTLKDFLPLVYDYLQDLVSDLNPLQLPTESRRYMKFMIETETFTRTCMFFDKEKTEPVPIRPEGAFAVFAGLFSIESTMIRHDLNRNGFIDGGYEVNKAYTDVYIDAIKGLVAPDGGFMEKLAKPIFLYLIKYGKAPDTSKFKSVMHFLKFLLKFRKQAPASRTTISSILRVIGEQSETNPFKCEECLRNPEVECLPEGDDW